MFILVLYISLNITLNETEGSVQLVESMNTVVGSNLKLFSYLRPLQQIIANTLLQTHDNSL
jgi:hypothetical protein